MNGYLNLVLHCHLPYVRHSEHEYFLEENWYYEALYETYLPLLYHFEDLENRKVPFRLTLSLSPTLISMCLDPLLQARAVRYADRLLELLEKERQRVKDDPAFRPVVEMYYFKLKEYRSFFNDRYQRNVALGFKKFQDLGRLEIITCAATHGYLPLLEPSEGAVRAQVETAVRVHESFFGKKPAGFWLPECGYQPGIDEWLRVYGIRYFFVETHGLLQAQPRPPYGTFAPVVCPTGLAAFGRDLESAKQVWSSKEGYPGDPFYREFYRDVGYDLEESYIHPYLQPDGLRRFIGLKYYRVTGSTDQKEPYDPSRAAARALDHARDFLERRKKQTMEVGKWMDRSPLVNCLYDAELFGHWWYEGPEFLDFLFTENHAQGAPIEFITSSDYLRKYPDNFLSQPAFSSWGLGGYSEFWLNEANHWVYPHLYKACGEMIQMASTRRKPEKLEERALNQAARELLLAQASDWTFMMKAGNYKAYAERRVKTHLSRFGQLVGQIKHQKIDARLLSDLEEKDNLFPQMDYRVYQAPGK